MTDPGTPATPVFRVGDRVRVRWMGETVEATVIELVLRDGSPHKTPHYWLSASGVEHRVGYQQDEMEPS